MTFDRMKPRSETHGAAHDKARKAWALKHDPAHLCARCHHTLGPMHSGLHLDHHDTDKSRYIGFSHGTPCPTCGIKCNVVAGAALGRAVQKAARQGAVPRAAKVTRRWY